MRTAKKVWAAAALLAFLALAAGASNSLPAPCCSAACDRCPLTVCAVAPADSPHGPGVEASPAHQEIAAPRPPQPGLGFFIAWNRSVPRFLSHEFRKPLRI